MTTTYTPQIDGAAPPGTPGYNNLYEYLYVRTVGIDNGVAYMPIAMGGLASKPSNSWLYAKMIATGIVLADADVITALNRIMILDTVNASSSGTLDAIRIVHRAGSFKGGRQTLKIDTILTAAPTEAIGRAYTPVEFVMAAGVTAGGDGTWSITPDDGYVGGIFGGNSNVRLAVGATNWNKIIGWEFDVTVSGGTVFNKFGILIVKGINDAVNAVGNDAAIVIADQDNPNTAPWKHGILFGVDYSVFPFGASSTMIGYQRRLYPTTDEVLANTETVAWGVDFRELNFGSGAFGSPGWMVGPTGYMEMTEQSDPAAPASNKGRLYMRDNGAGKTQIVARFPTGAIQVIATEP